MPVRASGAERRASSMLMTPFSISTPDSVTLPGSIGERSSAGIHSSVPSRAMRTLSSGSTMCISVTLNWPDSSGNSSISMLN